MKISKFENIGWLRFGLRSEYFSKMWLNRSWIISGIKNQLDSIKTHIFIPLWSALTQIFKKVIGHFQFWSPEWGSGAPKIDFSQHSYSQGAKKISRKDTTIIFCYSESWHSVLFKYVKIGAQNGAPEWQFSVDWKRCNSNLRQLLGVFLTSELHGLRFGLRLCMPKCAHGCFSSMQSLKMKFRMIFKAAGPKNMKFLSF